MSKIYIADMICGSGKTRSCFKLINESSSNDKFIFITPFLSEIERIKKKCPNKHFVSPWKQYSKKYKKVTKLDSLNSLLESGRNIASTHSLFLRSDKRTRDLIKEQGYTLILDEVIDVFQAASELSNDDIEALIAAGLVKRDKGKIVWAYEGTTGRFFNPVVEKLNNKFLVDAGEKEHEYVWLFPMDIFHAFKSIYLLTYLFYAHPLKHFFDKDGLSYEFIGCKKDGDEYRFCSAKDADRRLDLRDKIHIVENRKRNAIGDNWNDLSCGWFDENSNKNYETAKMKELRQNIYNAFRYDMPKCNKKKMWSTVGDYRGQISGEGYARGYVTFNCRATNDYSERTHLAYCINVFLPPLIANCIRREGAGEFNRDAASVSVLIQWLFRSNLRCGGEVWLYCPSARMRGLLKQWLDLLAEGRDLEPIKYIEGRKNGR